MVDKKIDDKIKIKSAGQQTVLMMAHSSAAVISCSNPEDRPNKKQENKNNGKSKRTFKEGELPICLSSWSTRVICPRFYCALAVLFS